MIRTIFIFVFLALTGLPGLAQDFGSDELSNTVFTGDFLEMVSGDEMSEFHLLGNVTVMGTNLNLTGDELHITAVKKGDKDATVTELRKIMKIIVVGNVKLKQAGRSAESGRAEFFPEDKKVLLTDNPVVTDAQGTVSGEEIEWFHGQRKAVVRGGQQRVRVTLAPIPDLGYDPNQVEEENENVEESEAETPPSDPANP